jgi:MFS family permease
VIIGGRLTEYYGIKKVYGLGLLLTAFLCFLSPVVAKANVYAFMVLRAFQGVFTGVTFPSLHAMTARWIPATERNSFIARSYFGSVFGLVITFPLCGLIIDKFGWETAFYVIGGITMIWFGFWWFLVFDTPDQHPRISKKELEHIKVCWLKITL